MNLEILFKGLEITAGIIIILFCLAALTYNP